MAFRDGARPDDTAEFERKAQAILNEHLLGLGCVRQAANDRCDLAVGPARAGISQRGLEYRGGSSSRSEIDISFGFGPLCVRYPRACVVSAGSSRS